MASIVLKGREYPLLYTTLEMKTIQERIASPLAKAVRLCTGRNPEDENDTEWFGSDRHLDALAKLIVIMAEAAAEEAGGDCDLTEKKVLRAMRPTEIGDAINACMAAFADGMHSEIEPKEEKGPVDVTLEQMNKKKEKEE